MKPFKLWRHISRKLYKIEQVPVICRGGDSACALLINQPRLSISSRRLNLIPVLPNSDLKLMTVKGFFHTDNKNGRRFRYPPHLSEANDCNKNAALTVVIATEFTTPLALFIILFLGFYFQRRWIFYE